MHTMQIYLVLLYYHWGICTVGAIDCVTFIGPDTQTNINNPLHMHKLNMV